MAEWNINLFDRGTREQKKAFVLTVLLGLFTHMYAFTNLILNHDCVNSILDRETTEHYIGLGRWAILPFLKISSTPVLPWVIGALSVLYMGMAAAMLVSIWELHSDIAIGLSGAVLVTFPVIASTFCYMYTADAYFAALALSVLYVYAMIKWKKAAFFPGCLLMAVVCAIYQPYWCLGAVLLAATLFIDYVRGKTEFVDFMKRGIACCINLAFSLGVYYLITRVIQGITGIGFSSYQDMDKLGQYGSLKEIYWYGRAAYYQFLAFFFRDGGFTGDERQNVLHVIILAAVLLLMAVFYYRSKRKWYEQVIFWGIVAMIPVAVNNLSVISRNRLWPVSMIAFEVPYFLAVICCEHFVFPKRKRVGKAVAGICAIAVACIVYMNYLTTNRIYARMDLAYEATYSWMTKMTLRLEECPGYDHDVPVAFINESDIETKNMLKQVRIFAVDFPEEMEIFADLDGMRDVDSRTMIRNELDVTDFCMEFLGFRLETLPNEERVKLYENEEVKQMPVYPAEGSVRKIDGQVVVKLPG